MAKNTNEQLSSSEVGQFIEYLDEILAGARPTPTPEMLSLMTRFKRLKSGESFHPEMDPLAFSRMGGVLYRGANPTMGEMSKILSLPFSTMSRMVDAGESIGILQRLPDPADGRVVRVALTDDGRRLHEAMKEMQSQGIKKVLVCLTPEERAILLTLLRKITTSMKTV